MAFAVPTSKVAHVAITAFPEYEGTEVAIDTYAPIGANRTVAFDTDSSLTQIVKCVALDGTPIVRAMPASDGSNPRIPAGFIVLEVLRGEVVVVLTDNWGLRKVTIHANDADLPIILRNAK